MSVLEKVYDESLCIECHEYPHHPDCSVKRMADTIAILTAERDRAIDQTMRLFREIGQLIAERDALKEKLACAVDSHIKNCDERDALKSVVDLQDQSIKAYQEEWRSHLTERDALREDLRAVAEALDMIFKQGIMYPSEHSYNTAKETLNRPGVQAVLAESKS